MNDDDELSSAGTLRAGHVLFCWLWACRASNDAKPCTQDHQKPATACHAYAATTARHTGVLLHHFECRPRWAGAPEGKQKAAAALPARAARARPGPGPAMQGARGDWARAGALSAGTVALCLACAPAEVAVDKLWWTVQGVVGAAARAFGGSDARPPPARTPAMRQVSGRDKETAVVVDGCDAASSSSIASAVETVNIVFAESVVLPAAGAETGVEVEAEATATTIVVAGGTPPPFAATTDEENGGRDGADDGDTGPMSPLAPSPSPRKTTPPPRLTRAAEEEADTAPPRGCQVATQAQAQAQAQNDSPLLSSAEFVLLDLLRQEQRPGQRCSCEDGGRRHTARQKQRHASASILAAFQLAARGKQPQQSDVG